MRLSAFAIMVGLVPLASACRSKIDVKTKVGAPLPAEETPVEEEPQVTDPDEGKNDPTPIDPASLVQSTRKFFQTRDVIVLPLSKEAFIGAQHYRLLNVTRRAKGEAPKVLVDEDVPHGNEQLQRGYRKSERFALTDASDTEFTISFYPGPEGWAGRFFYGKNEIELYIDDEVAPRMTFNDLTLLDFDVFGVAVTSFGNNVQVATTSDGFQFQGWVNVLSNPTVYAVETSDGVGKVKGILTNGLFNMVNPY